MVEVEVGVGMVEGVEGVEEGRVEVLEQRPAAQAKEARQGQARLGQEGGDAPASGRW